MALAVNSDKTINYSVQRLSIDDFNFIKDTSFKLALYDGYNAVYDTNLVEFIKNNDIQSFMFPKNIPKNLEKQWNKMGRLADVRAGHSGASFGLTMRSVEYILKHGIHAFKNAYTMS